MNNKQIIALFTSLLLIGLVSIARAQDVKYYEVKEAAAMSVKVPGANVSGYEVKPENLITPISLDMTGHTTVSKEIPANSTAPILIKKVAGKTYILTVTEKGVIIPPVEPPATKPITIEGESLSVAGTCRVTAGAITAIGCTKPNITLTYPIDAKVAGNMTISISSGTTNGKMQVQAGTTKKSFDVPNTGNFDTYKDWPGFDFVIPAGAKEVIFTFVGGNIYGSVNINSFTYTPNK